MQQAAPTSTRLRCDPTDYARKQQEKKDRAKELRDNRHRGSYSEEHTFAPKVNPREKGQTPSSREEDERPGGMQAHSSRGGAATRRAEPADVPIRPSKTLQASRKEILDPEEVPPRRAGANNKSNGTASSSSNSSSGGGHGNNWGGSARGRMTNNNADHQHDADVDPASDALDALSRKFPKKKTVPEPPKPDHQSLAPLEPEHDSLFREVKRTTGHALDDIPIKKLNAGGAPAMGKHTGPCLRNSSCGCPQCGGGGGGAGSGGGGGAISSSGGSSRSARPDPPPRRRESRAEPPMEPQTHSARSTNSASQNEMENSLTLLKSKMARQKARTPSNQTPHASSSGRRGYANDQPTLSARQPSAGYASSSPSSTPTSKIPTVGTGRRTSASPPTTTQRTPPAAASRRQPSGRADEDRSSVGATNRRAPTKRQEEHDDDDNASDAIRYPPPISSGFKESEGPSEYPDEQEEMEECGNCHRRFNVTSLQKHSKICDKVFTAQRKVFNMAAKRVEGTEIEKLNKQGKRGGGAAKKAAGGDEIPVKAKAVDWKKQSSAFREAMRASRGVTQALKDGTPLPPMAPSAPDPSLIPCDYCGRRFNDRAAERHIPYCKEKSQKMGNKAPPPKKAAAPAPKAPATRAPARKK